MSIPGIWRSARRASRWVLCVVMAAAVLTLVGCAVLSVRAQGSARPRNLVVFAAASMTEAFGDAGRDFEGTHPDVRVTFNFAGSQQLRAQLEHGAAADVFAAADTTEMASAIAAHLVVTGTQVAFAGNSLAIIAPTANQAGLHTLADLARRGVKIAVADPSVPVGRYTLAMLAAAERDPANGPGFRERVLANVVSREENVKAVVSKVRLDEVDAGVVYQSDTTGGDGDALYVIDVPAAYNPAAVYPAAPLVEAHEPELARQFIEYLLSPAGQQVLRKHGFTTVATARE